MLPIRKILCPTDFSEPSFTGVAAADELARHFAAELVLVTVVTPVHPTGMAVVPASYQIAQIQEQMTIHATRSLEKVVTERISPGVPIQQFVAHGNAADEITAHAARQSVDLLVIATHGWSGWRRLVFGSVAEKVVRSAACPVLAVNGPPA
jgi:universal stress protein A